MKNTFGKHSLSQALSKMPKARQTKITEDMTSAGRLDKMLGSDSPLMKRAKTQGQQMAQQRGLLNSSMAAGASQGAMIDRAQPFALQDSSSLIDTAQRNTAAQNQRGLLQSQLIGDSYKSNQDYAQQRGLNEQAYGFERGLAEQQFGYQEQRDETQNQYARDMARLQQELNEAQAQGDFGREKELLGEQAQIQRRRDERLDDFQSARDERQFGYEQQMADQQADIQAGRDERLDDFQSARDERLSGFDRDMRRLDAELQEAQASNDFGRAQELEQQRADLQQERDELLDRQQISRDERLSGFDRDMRRLDAELQEAQAGNDFGRAQKLERQRADIQADRDETLFQYDLENTERQADIQAARDQRLSDLDADAARLQSELQEAQAENDFARTKGLNKQQADLQETRDKLLFAQNMESMTEEYGLRDDLAKSEAERAMKEMFAASKGNAWGVMSGNITDLVAQSSSEIQQIQMNPNISSEDKTTMIDDVIKRRDTDLEFQQSMYDSMSDTLLNSGAFPSGDLNSPERKRIRDIYQQELGKKADGVGLDFWAERSQGMSDSELRKAIKAGA